MFKNTAKRISAIILAATMLVTTAFAAAGGTGEAKYSNTLEIADGFTYTNTISYNSSGRRVEAYMVRTEQHGDVYPIVLACDTMYGGMTISRVISYAEGLGYNVMGAVNTDFFATSTKVPLGAVVQDGKYLSSPEGSNILAFSKEDAFVSEGATINITLKNGEKTTALTHLNKTRVDAGGLYLYTSAFSTVSTRTSTDGWAVRFKILDGELSVSGKVTLEVSEVIPSGTAFEIGDEYMVLTAAAAAGLSAERDKYAVGDIVTLETSCSDHELVDAEWATGCGDMIVSGGKVANDDSWDSSLFGTHPRTAVGIKPDGSIVYYVIDGRTNASTGAKLSELAQDLIAEGCEYAVNMDGGGSSALSVRLPGSSSCRTVNSPSDGSERSCGTYILFVTDRQPDSDAENLYLRQEGSFVLAGSSMDLSYYASDSGFRNVSVPGDIEADAETGRISGSVYTAAEKAGQDIIRLSSSSTGASGKGTVHVIDAGDTLSVTDSATDKAPEMGALSQGDTIQLSASLSYLSRGVYMDRSAVAYSVSGNVGTISSDGLFTATGVPGSSGTITVKAGGVTKTLNVTLKVEFLDIKDHWARSYIEKLYNAGVVTGTSSSAFNPNDDIRRCDFMLMIYRAAGSPGISENTSFSDVSSSAYYAKAVAWAEKNGIAQGAGDGTFLPESTLTREQAFTFMYRALPLLGDKASDGNPELLLRFSDADKVASYAKTPTATLISLGIVSGGSDGKLNPQGSLTRAEMAKILCAAIYSAG